MYIKNILLIFSAFIFVRPSFGQVQGKICNWDNDKKAAVVLTFDDWSPAHYNLVTPELQNRHINATFFIPTNAVSNWSQLQTEVSYGNEIANHSKSHPDLTKLTPAQQQDEIRGAKTLIDQNVTSRTTTTFAYPYGAFNNAVIDSVINSGHIASRGVWPASGNYTYNFATTNADYYNILTYGMDGAVTTEKFYTQISNVIHGGGLLTYLYHCIVNPTYPASSCGTGPVDLAVFKKQLDTLVYVKDKVWITTFEKAIKYHREKKSASLSEIQAPNGIQWVLGLTDGLSDNALYNLPLTIKLKMNGVNYDQVLQNGNPLTIDAIKNDTIMFHAVPDGGQIILKVSTGIVISSATVMPSVVSNSTSNNLAFAVTATDDGSISKVEIDLSSIGGGKTAMTSAGGNNYTLSHNLPAGTSTGIKNLTVTATDNSGNTNTSTISMNVTSGTVISGSVSPSTVFNNASTPVIFSVAATDDGSVSSVSIDLSSIGGAPAISMNAGGGGNYALSYTVPEGTAVGNKSIIVSVTDNMGNVTTANIVLTVTPHLIYLDIYTDNNSMICAGCTWASGTLEEQSNAGAIEGIKDYLYSYNITNGWAGMGLNISNWSPAQAKDFSGYDNLQLSYKGPIGSGNAFISLTDPSGSSTSINLPSVANYTTFSIPLSSFTGIDLSKITELNISIGGSVSGSGTLRIDNVKLSASNGGGTGTILREYWTGLSGASISNLTSNAKYPYHPSGNEQLTSLEGPTNWADNYGARIRGYLHPSTSGNYTFWVAGDDTAELYLSTDDNPENAVRIAFVNSSTNPREWGKYTTQQSAAVSLTAGQKYYVEVLHKESSSGDNVAVAWQGPEVTKNVIRGSFLSPYMPATIVGTEPTAEVVASNINIYPNPAHHGRFTIVLPDLVRNAKVNIFDSQGRMLYENFIHGVTELKMETCLKAGIYLVKVRTERSNFIQKLIVH